MAREQTTGSPPMVGKCLGLGEIERYIMGYDFGSLPPSRVVLHHTWIPTVAQWRGLPTMKGMQTFYRGKGWRAAPHWYIGPDGGWLFTPMREVGIHAGLGNANVAFQRTWRFADLRWYSIGVELVGNYDKVKPAGDILEGMRVVLGALSNRLRIPIKDLVSFHRDYTNTKSCPGWAVTKPWVVAEVEAWQHRQK